MSQSDTTDSSLEQAEEIDDIEFVDSESKEEDDVDLDIDEEVVAGPDYY